MTDEQQKAIDELRSGNLKLASLVRDGVNEAVRKSIDLIGSAENANDLLNSIRA